MLSSFGSGSLCFKSDMAWTTLQYTKNEVNTAGTVLANLTIDRLISGEADNAYIIINNWRSCHSFPLNTLQNRLRHKAKEVYPRALIAQRIKRLSSITFKLNRFPNMKLSQMQDIAGCRAVVGSVGSVKQLVSHLKESRIKHKLIDEDDYIQKPKESGYRGVHLIYRYYSDRNETHNGRKIEMQIRSPLQHAWATAVETVGTFIGQALKASQGEQEWLRFFALMGTAIANRERTPPVPNTPMSKIELKQQLKGYAERLDVEGHLRAYGAAFRTLEQPSVKNADYFLLRFDPVAKTTTITGYRLEHLDQANRDYLAIEREIRGQSTVGADAVLVSVDSVAALKRAYPNYFLDTHLFLDAVKHEIGQLGTSR